MVAFARALTKRIADRVLACHGHHWWPCMALWSAALTTLGAYGTLLLTGYLTPPARFLSHLLG
jgi:hypothetical protein